MTGRRAFGHVLVATLLVAGCGSSRTAESPPADQPGSRPAVAAAANNSAVSTAAAEAAAPALALEVDGLRLFVPPSSAARPIAFGTAQADVLRVLAFRGSAETGKMEECGAGPIDYASWPDGFKAYFQEGKFVGWAVDYRPDKPDFRPLTTAAGIGPGSTRAQLDDAYSAQVEETSLGTEFSAGGMSGVLDGDKPGSRINVMWAGESCAMR